MSVRSVMKMLLAAMVLLGSTLAVDSTPAAAASFANVRLIADGKLRRIAIPFSDRVNSLGGCRDKTLTGTVFIDDVARRTSFDIRGLSIQLAGLNKGQTLPISLQKYSFRVSRTRVEEGDSDFGEAKVQTAKLYPDEINPTRVGTLSVYTRTSNGKMAWIPFALKDIQYSYAQATLTLARNDPNQYIYGACDGIWVINSFTRA
jgi:hypothetical protein